MTDGDDRILQFPAPGVPEHPGPPEFIIGPFQERRVVLEGKLIPNLTATYEGDNIGLFLDGRLSISVPKELAYVVAWFAANAMAIGAGYACFTAEKKVEAFAPRCGEIGQ